MAPIQCDQHEPVAIVGMGKSANRPIDRQTAEVTR